MLFLSKILITGLYFIKSFQINKLKSSQTLVYRIQYTLKGQLKWMPKL